MLWVRRLIWAAVLVAGIGAVAATRLNATERTEKGNLGRVPAFSLLDQHARPVTDRDLAGSLWVANFVFTRCGNVCPLLTAKFAALQARLALPKVRYVSISVDPSHDTPQVLAEYATRFRASEQWLFLTGPLAEIEKTVVDGFKMHIGERKESPSLVEIMHGEHFVLVDKTGVIRGFYRSDEPGLAELEHDLRALSK